MTEDEAIAMHKALAEYHRALAKGAMLAHDHHAELADRLTREVEMIAKRKRTLIADQFAPS